MSISRQEPGNELVVHRAANGIIDAVLITREQTSLLLDIPFQASPAVTYWGAALKGVTESALPEIIASQQKAIPNNSLDKPVRAAILPDASDGWLGTPGVEGSRADRSAFSLRLAAADTQLETRSDRVKISIRVVDSSQKISGLIQLTVEPSGLIGMKVRLKNEGTEDYWLNALCPMLPLPAKATEILDFTGNWSQERIPQRQVLNVGKHSRLNRRGRTGADSAYVYHVGVPGFGFQHGEIWAVHTAFSGNQIHFSEHVATGNSVIGGAELLYPGEIVLAPGEAYETPAIYAAYGMGLDEIARQFHRHLRNQKPLLSQRKVNLNVWEAVYFDQNIEKLKELAQRAAEVGVERFVLDDGWFSSRRNDRSGLGDWTVSDTVWPQGLDELVEYVAGLGMDFGIWFEPEMVNLDSDTARAHPDWLMSARGSQLPPESRHQQGLNLAIPEAWNHVYSQMRAILGRYGIRYVKWDQNRDLVEPGDYSDGTSALHNHVYAAYRLAAALKTDFPDLEIETCSSGGAKIDLGIAQFSDRFWASDCNDPLERIQINYWTTQLLPPEYIGSHIASETSHTTGRRHSLSTRAGASVLFNFGVEWDLTMIAPAALAELRTWITWHKSLRDFIQTATVVRPDYADPALQIFGLRNAERTRALFSMATVGRPRDATPASLLIPGLSSSLRYRVRWIQPGGMPSGFTPAGRQSGAFSHADPAVKTPSENQPFALEQGIFSGSVLREIGLPLPLMHPEQVLFLELNAI